MSSTDKPVCELCGEPMPEGEEMFRYHGYSGPCPKQTVNIRNVPPEHKRKLEEEDED